MPRLPLDPRHGTHEPTTDVPARRPGSVRRTTSIDMLRPHGVDGDLVLVGRGPRPAHRTPTTSTAVLDTAAIEATIDYADAQRLTVALVARPRSTGSSGCWAARRPPASAPRSTRSSPAHDVVGRPVYQLLDDLPVATLISGYAPQHAMAQSGDWADEQKRSAMRKRAPEGLAMLQQADLCAGWKAGGTIMQGFAEGVPPVVTGPDAPVARRRDDPLAWHELPARSRSQCMRRRRRIDVLPDGRPPI